MISDAIPSRFGISSNFKNLKIQKPVLEPLSINQHHAPTPPTPINLKKKSLLSKEDLHKRSTNRILFMLNDGKANQPTKSSPLLNASQPIKTKKHNKNKSWQQNSPSSPIVRPSTSMTTTSTNKNNKKKQSSFFTEPKQNKYSTTKEKRRTAFQLEEDIEELLPDFDAAFDFLHERKGLILKNSELKKEIKKKDTLIRTLKIEKARLLLSTSKNYTKITAMSQKMDKLKAKANHKEHLAKRMKKTTDITEKYWKRDLESADEKLSLAKQKFKELEEAYTRASLEHKMALEKIKKEQEESIHSNGAMDFRQEVELKLYKSLADHFEGKWNTVEPLINSLKSQLHKQQEMAEEKMNENKTLKADLKKTKKSLKKYKEQAISLEKHQIELAEQLEIERFKNKQAQELLDEAQQELDESSSPSNASSQAIKGKAKKKLKNRFTISDKIVGITGETNEQGQWVYYKNIKDYDQKQVGKKNEKTGFIHPDTKLWIWNVGYNPMFRIGKRLHGITGRYDDGNWTYFPMFDPKTYGDRFKESELSLQSLVDKSGKPMDFAAFSSEMSSYANSSMALHSSTGGKNGSSSSGPSNVKARSVVRDQMRPVKGWKPTKYKKSKFDKEKLAKAFT